jgi:tetratricopeptide (TPR) repeat protein
MLAALAGAKEAAEKAVRALEEGERRFGIVGGEGSGKSAALDEVSCALDAKHEVVHRLAITRGDDAAFAAMVTLAGQLDPADKGVLRLVRDGKPRFSEKLTCLSEELEKRRGTLLLDDPPLRTLDLTATVFDDRLAELNERLLQLRDVRVVVASRHPFPGRSVNIRPRFDVASVLGTMTRGAFGNAATALHGHPLDGYSPVEVRLIVAAVDRNATRTPSMSHRWDPSELLEVVLEGEPELRQLIGALSLLRVPFDDDLLAGLGAASLSARRRALLYEVLLLHTPAGYIVHGLIARRARGDEWLGRAERIAAHGSLASWHGRRFEACKTADKLAGAFAHEIEMVHHLTEAGDVEAVLRASVYFPEQYDALGKALSIGERYADAARAYERAVAFDEPPDRIDAYGHHYLAYNLDVLAEDAERVRAEYEKARDAQPTHPWFWGRFICFLITTGELDRAMNVWSEAAAAFQLDQGEEWIAAELHRNVAHLLTYRGQIDGARRVLRDVPRAARSTDWFLALDGWLAELEAAERDQLVFPPNLATDERWSGPHLLRNPLDRERVVTWIPGRITSVDVDGIRVRCASKDLSGTVTYRYRDLSDDALSKLSTYPRYGLQLPAGTFIEILTMNDGAGGTLEQLLSWPRQTHRFARLPDIFPKPDRYIRRALTRR